MDEDVMEKLATEELMLEAERGAARASVNGPTGWQKCPRTNKRFLCNTLLQSLHWNRVSRQPNLNRPARRINGDEPSRTQDHKSRRDHERERVKFDVESKFKRKKSDMEVLDNVGTSSKKEAKIEKEGRPSSKCTENETLDSETKCKGNKSDKVPKDVGPSSNKKSGSKVAENGIPVIDLGSKKEKYKSDKMVPEDIYLSNKKKSSSKLAANVIIDLESEWKGHKSDKTVSKDVSRRRKKKSKRSKRGRSSSKSAEPEIIDVEKEWKDHKPGKKGRLPKYLGSSSKEKAKVLKQARPRSTSAEHEVINLDC